MRHVIFYSWQSDLDPALTRNFIEDALKRAIKSLNRDEEVSVEAVIDRDTAGVAGAPSIAETIFQKIDSCDVFICDVSIVNTAAAGESSHASRFVRLVRSAARTALHLTAREKRVTRPMPNPNVLIELGYAAATIGWDRVILVQNTAFGDLGLAPFDLGSRRIFSFNLSAREYRGQERPKLSIGLENRLRIALAPILVLTPWMGSRRARWFGIWHTDQLPLRHNEILIREVGATGFMFHLYLADGARAGDVSGFAVFTGPDSAYARIATGNDGRLCELKFRRTLDPIRLMFIEETLGCAYFSGLGTGFGGIYKVREDLLFDSGTLDELDLQRLHSITGEYYRPLMERFLRIGPGENIDKFRATVTIGGVRGLYTIREGILMRGEDGQLWVAYIEDNIVRYFTTEREFMRRLPKTIEEWRQRFLDKNVVFTDRVTTIPQP